MHSTPAKVRRIIYAASTHWDREWYLSYQSFRFRLVNTMDEIIDTLERTPDFARFILDGHAILLEDYLDIRPEMLPRLKKLLAENRIQAGPWLTMPDERLSSGESLISNLQLGFETVRSLGGEPMKCGYLCDIFGHVAQLPQILGGFGVFSALLGRGTNMEDTQALFNWRSPDGSGCVCFKVPEEIGYATFHFDVLAPYLDGRDRDRDNMLKRAAAYVQKEIERSPLPYIFLIDGMDHERIHPDAVELVTKLSEHFGCEAEFGLTDTLLAELNENSGALKTMQGELCQTAKRFVEHHKVVPHTLSSRYDTKLLNDECQTMLERIAWPLATMLELNGKQIPPRYFRLVSGWLAENQTHDSICGCSIDAVCLDVLNRYKQAGNVLREVIDFASKELASLGDQTPEYALGARIPDDFIKTRQIDAPGRARSADILRLTVFNTEPARYAGAVIADIHFPTDYTAKYGEYLPYENQNMFRLFDSAGNEIPYQLLDIKTNSFVSKPQEFYRVKRDRYTIAFQADIPAMSYAELLVRPSEVPVRNVGTLRTSDLRAENDFMIVEVRPDGTLILTDKSSGAVYKNLCVFKDYGETGDGWVHAPPIGNPAVCSYDGNTSIEARHDGSEFCTFSITKHMWLAKEMTGKPPQARRSEEKALVELCASVTLAKKARWVDVRVDIDNCVKDHRMNVSFETGLDGENYEADQAFAIVERKIADGSTHDWKEMNRGDGCFSNLVMKREQNTGRGLAFLSKGGLHECKAVRSAKGALEITLFRSFGNTFLTDGEPDGQMQGALSFQFAFMPVGSGDSNGDIIRLRDSYVNAPFAYSSIVQSDYIPQNGAAGFSLTSKNVALSTIRPAKKEGFACIRLVNYGADAETIRLDCPSKIVRAFRADLLENPSASLPHEEKRLELSVDGFKIVTILAEFTQFA